MFDVVVMLFEVVLDVALNACVTILVHVPRSSIALVMCMILV